ncbi:hypothetical protein HLB23_34685 [Nocardia uniformis]|uniref:Uncharacterized protein n=1 Tax=Nocardia uniformis TaxID=53432 RepID=A0A849CGN2_9NOCA|nr:hypothetical protein [Nocardia uniformis]NNH74939.1 hypothetical protein [Nocardia uniformis]
MLGIDGCLQLIMDIPGARSATLVDGASGLAIAGAGEHELVDQHEDAAGTTDVVRAVLACPALASGRDGDDIREILVCGTRGYHLLNLIDGDFDGRLFVHVLFDDDSGNLAMARYRLRGILDEFAGVQYAGDGRER